MFVLGLCFLLSSSHGGGRLDHKIGFGRGKLEVPSEKTNSLPSSAPLPSP